MTEHCAWCGADYYDDEVGDELQLVNGDYKCRTCMVEDCRHVNTYTDYTASSAHRARFVQVCIDCTSWREFRFYFEGKQARVIGPWRTDEVIG